MALCDAAWKVRRLVSQRSHAQCCRRAGLRNCCGLCEACHSVCSPPDCAAVCGIASTSCANSFLDAATVALAGHRLQWVRSCVTVLCAAESEPKVHPHARCKVLLGAASLHRQVPGPLRRPRAAVPSVGGQGDGLQQQTVPPGRPGLPQRLRCAAVPAKTLPLARSLARRMTNFASAGAATAGSTPLAMSLSACDHVWRQAVEVKQ